MMEIKADMRLIPSPNRRLASRNLFATSSVLMSCVSIEVIVRDDMMIDETHARTCELLNLTAISPPYIARRFLILVGVVNVLHLYIVCYHFSTFARVFRCEYREQRRWWPVGKDGGGRRKRDAPRGVATRSRST